MVHFDSELKARSRLRRLNLVARERLLRLFPQGHRGLLFRVDVEGYRDSCFGAVTGPVKSIQKGLFHELAHAAEFGPEFFSQRYSPEGWCFREPHRVAVAGTSYLDPVTDGATQRELRTFAHQMVLLELAGYRIDRKVFAMDCAQTMTFMPDWCHILPGKEMPKRIAYCARRILAVHAVLVPEVVLARLHGWLDETAEEERSPEHRRPFRRVGDRECLEPPAWTAERESVARSRVRMAG